MAGVVFIIYIPSEAKETLLASRKNSKRTINNEQILVDNASEPFSNNNKIKEPEQQQLLPENRRDSEEKKLGTNCITMKKVMEDIIKELNIENSVWSTSTNGDYIQIVFTVESGNHYEEILVVLKENRIGLKYNSVVSVTPCTLYYKGSCCKDKECFEEDDDEQEEDKDSLWTKFLSSVRARLTVAQVVENINTQADLTFDFICLLIIATTLCAIGLVENSNVYLLSSMLISPMMGPVMAATFGTVIRDRALQKMGVQNELLGLGIAMIVGFCYGTMICLSTDKYGESDWPTNEMISRGEVRTIGVGCLIALLSGAAVALGVLSDNIASLVGVAISTSLMPPAVNAGLLWSVASVYYLKGNETTRYSTLAYTNYYSDNRVTELTSLGGMSLCLTFVNIVCIYVAGILVFKMKEVAPMASKDNAKGRFWNHDIKIARDYNRNMNSDDSKTVDHPVDPLQHPRTVEIKKQQFLNEQLHRSIDLAHSINHLDRHHCHCKSQYTWSPCMASKEKPTLKELEDMYKNFCGQRRDEKKQQSPAQRLPFAAFMSRRLSSHRDGDFCNISKECLCREMGARSSSDDSVSSKKNFLKTQESNKFTVTACSDALINISQ